MIERGEITAALSFVAILGFFLFLASALGGCGGRCGSSACIGIDPIEPPVEPAPDVEVDCPEGYVCLERDVFLTFVGNVCTHCQDSVVCEDDTDWTDECDADVPPGHLSKSCPDVRGNRD